ncbi:hypothetical protein [Salimicrobium album]|nr:hypothetical protein [Salimicrobium album]
MNQSNIYDFLNVDQDPGRPFIKLFDIMALSGWMVTMPQTGHFAKDKI